MIPKLFYLLAPLLFILAGLFVFCVPQIRRLGVPATICASFFAGNVVMVVWALLLTTFEVPWTPLTLLGSLLLTQCLWLAIRWRRNGPNHTQQQPVPGQDHDWKALALPGVLIALALAHLALASLTSRASSSDYFYFWGTKGVRFALEEGLDWQWLRAPENMHAHSNYPPLVPFVYAWGAIVSGRHSWQLGMVIGTLYIALTIPLIQSLLRRHLRDGTAWAATTLWTVAICVSMVSSLSAGSAEPQLVAFLTLAAAGLLVRPRVPWIAAIGLAGAALTKSEGMIAGGFILFGYIVSSLMEKRWSVKEAMALIVAPIAAWGTWFLFEVLHGIPLVDAAREPIGQIRFTWIREILSGYLTNLDGGTWYLSLLPPLVFLLFHLRRWPRIAEALTLSGGILAFAFVYYLHHPKDPTVWISWTLPRLIQSPISALILAAVVMLSMRLESSVAVERK